MWDPKHDFEETASGTPRPRRPKVWTDDNVCTVVVKFLMTQTVCEVEDLDSAAKIDGIVIVNGVINVCKSGFDKGKSPQR